MSEAVKTMFAGIANRYDMLNQVLSARRDVAWRRLALGDLAAAGGSGRLLDLATGTGDVGLDALARGQASCVFGMDFCTEMMLAGRRRQRGFAFTTTTADGLNLPLVDGSVDQASVSFGWRNFDDPARGARELHRVIRPGGHVLVIEFFRPQSWFTKLFHRCFSLGAPLVGALLTGKGSAYAYLHQSIQKFLSIDEAHQTLTDAGFEVVNTRPLSGGIAHAIVARRADGGLSADAD